MALAARDPDIIIRTSIPLAATSDQPLAEVARPPESASNDVTDQTGGTPKEMTAEELAAATAARKDAGPDANPKTDGTVQEPAETDPTKTADPPKLEFDAIPEGLPGYAVREITRHRKQAQAKADAAWKAAQASVGDEAWTKALSVARDAEVEAARKETKIAKDATDAVRKELDELRAKTPAEPVKEPEVDARPTRDTFDDPDAYDTALTEWATREGERKAQAKIDADKVAAEAETARKAEEEENTAREAELTKIHTDWTAKVEAATEKYPDYVEVTTAEDLKVSNAMVAAMMQIDNGTDIAYHLGKNPEDSARIAALSNPAKHFIEIGRIAERLANPPRRARPAAPIEPIDTTRNTADTSDSEPDMEAYAARRNKQLQAERRPFFPAGGIH